METISEDEIQKSLSEQANGSVDRDLVKNERLDDHGGKVGSVVYSLRGSPPKGYAIAIPELKEVSFYDNRGKRFRRERNTIVE